jgi:hypothetical protein
MEPDVLPDDACHPAHSPSYPARRVALGLTWWFFITVIVVLKLQQQQQNATTTTTTKVSEDTWGSLAPSAD